MRKATCQISLGCFRYIWGLILFITLVTPAVASLSSEQAVLADLYEATNGSSWRDASHWRLQNGSVCNWEGVTCNSNRDAVVGLDLADRNLSSKLPDIFAGLPNLQQLDLRNNHLSGNVPESLGKIQPLKNLELQRNLMVGSPEAMIQPIIDRGGSVDIRYNGFYGSEAFAAQTAVNDGFPATQTLDAEIVQVSDVGKFSAVVTWVPVSFTIAGGYLIEFTANDGSIVTREVIGKQNNQQRVAGLDVDETYRVVVRSYTNPHDENSNRVVSDGKQFAPFTITTGNQAPLQDVAGDSGSLGSVVTSRGGGAMGTGLLILLIAGVLRTVGFQSRGFLTTFLISTTLISTTLISTTAVFADQRTTYDRHGNTITSHDGRFYGGFSGGISKLKPKVESGVGLTLDGGSEFGGKAILGYELTDKLSIEGFLGKLGEAEFNPEGSIDYSNYGVGLVLNGLRRISRFNPIGKIGLNKISNSPYRISYRRDDDYPVFLTAGLEYPLQQDLMIRAELDYFAADARMFSLGVVKHFGVYRPPPAPAIVLEPEPAPVIVVEPEVFDADGDGIEDHFDECPHSPYDAQVDERGCAGFQGYLQGVNFETNSSRLTPRARDILDQVAAELSQFPNIEVEVQAHTDDEGSARYNQWLSERRAWSVVQYLGSKGLNTSRLRPVGLGEFSPAATNNTAQGKRANRRVVFEVRQQN